MNKTYKKGSRIILSIVLITLGFLLIKTMGGITGHAVLEGAGTVEDPYQITNCTDLQSINDDSTAFYQLMNDIDCSDTINWNTGDGFDPIGRFTGDFDGQNYIITNLFINISGTNNVGLFANMSTANVSNIGLINSYIYGATYVGGLVGYTSAYSYIDNAYVQGQIKGYAKVGGIIGFNKKSIINNSNSSAIITGTNDNIGGLVGKNENSTVDNSFTTGNVTGRFNIGGLVGRNNAHYSGVTTINNSYATGNITGVNSIGGLVGYNHVSYAGVTTIDNSYATGNVTGVNSIGGLVGLNYAYYYYSVAIVDNSYSTGDVIGNDDVGGLVGLNFAHYSGNITIKNSYTTGNINGNDHIGGLVGYDTASYYNAVATINNSYATGNITGVNSIGGLVGFNYAYSYAGTTVDNSYATGNINGDSIIGGLVGYNKAYYFGVITVDNSYATGNVTGVYSNIGGLVGKNYAYNSGNITVNNSYANGKITGSSISCSRTGGLVGENYGYSSGYATIDNSYATGNINSDHYVGGLVGRNYGQSSGIAIVDNSYATGNVTGDDWIGGLVGFNYGQSYGIATVDNSYANGDVIAGDYVGGLVGKNYGYSSGIGTVDNSYATGNVTGEDKVGGLVGYNNGYYSGVATVDNSYATGNVTGLLHTGGLVGFNYGHNSGIATVDNSYATGNVDGGDRIGGLVGYNYGLSSGVATVDNSYATGNVNGNDDVGGLVGQNFASSNGEVNINNSYAIGNVTGNNNVGGLVGNNEVGYYTDIATVDNSFATGTVTGNYDVGGLVGENYYGTVDNSYWLNDTINDCIGNNAVSGFSTDCDGLTGSAGVVDSEDSEYFFNWTNLPMDNWAFPPWSNFCDGSGYLSLAWQGISNVANCIGYVIVTDTTSPIITINNPLNNTNINSNNLSVTLNVSFDETVNSSYSIDSIPENITLCSVCTSNVTTVTFTNYGNHTITIWANDTSNNAATNSTTFNLVLDTDGDGNPDYSDFLKGNLTDVTTNITLNLTIGGSTNLSQQFNGTQEIIFTNTTDTILEFLYDFDSNKTLDLTNITILDTSSSTTASMLVAGINMTNSGQTKTMHILKKNAAMNGICVKDLEIPSISNISTTCTDTNEVKVECDGSAQSGYTCTLNSSINRYKIEGLVHSGVKQISYTQPAAVQPAITQPSTSDGASSMLTISNTATKAIIYKYSKFNFKSQVSSKSDYEHHNIRIKSIGENFANLQIFSTPQEVKIKVNELAKIDLDNDEFYDLEIKLISVFSNKVELTLKSIKEIKVAPSVEETESKPVIKQDEVIKPQPVERTPVQEVPSQDLGFLNKDITKYLIILVISLIGFLVFINDKTNN